MKTILLTGCSSGIGKETALLLLEKGYSVIGISRRSCPFFAEHKNFHHFSIDLFSLNNLAVHLKKIEQQHPQIDGIICNAGKGYFGHLEELSSQNIRALVDLNFLSPVLIIRHFLPLFKKRKNGEIIFIGSTAASKEQKQNSIYGATKAALSSFAASLREECRKANVRVHLISPGIVRTPFYSQLSFSPSVKEDASLLPIDIAQLIVMILELPSRIVWEEISLSPIQKELQFLSHHKSPEKVEE